MWFWQDFTSPVTAVCQALQCEMLNGMYTGALNGPTVHFRVLQFCDSDLARLGLFALEQGQPPGATALA